MKTLALIILAGRNQKNLSRCVESIGLLSIKPDELIVVFDNKNCGDMDYEIDIKDIKIKYINYYGEGHQPHMRNIAIKATNADYLWFVDDDVSLNKDSCKELKYLISNISENNKIGAIAGRIIEDAKFDVKKLRIPIYLSFCRGAVGYFNWTYEQFPNTRYEIIKLSKLGDIFVIPFVQGTNMIFSREACVEIGGFDEDLGFGYSSYEDSEICFTLSKKNYKIIYYPNVELTHHKLPRVAGASRGYNDYSYATSLMRNYTISLLKNNYPSYYLSKVYLIMFLLIHPLRVFKYSNKNLLSLLHAYSAVFYGYSLGKKAVKRSSSRRIGLEIN